MGSFQVSPIRPKVTVSPICKFQASWAQHNHLNLRSCLISRKPEIHYNFIFPAWGGWNTFTFWDPTQSLIMFKARFFVGFCTLKRRDFVHQTPWGTSSFQFPLVVSIWFFNYVYTTIKTVSQLFDLCFLAYLRVENRGSWHKNYYSSSLRGVSSCSTVLIKLKSMIWFDWSFMKLLIFGVEELWGSNTHTNHITN